MTTAHRSASERLVSSTLAAVLAASILVAGCGKEAKKDAARAPIEVTAMTVVPGDHSISSVFVAQTQSSQAVTIAARVSGFLDKRVYTEGSVVKAGQVLFRMDQKPFQAQVDAAAAALQRNQAALQVAQANLGRTKPLAAQNALSQKDLDDAQGQYEQSEAAVAQSKAQLEQAQLDLSYTTITSPVDGVSSFAAVADGTYVNAQNSQLTTISVLSPMWINFSVSENEMERIRSEVQKGTLRLPENNQFIVEIELAEGQIFPQRGKITFADPSYNSQTGTFLIRATVDNPKGVLRPNQYVRTRLIGATRPNAILIPQRAVQQGAKGHFVWVVNKDNKAELRPVVVGDWYRDYWFIAQGLAGGDRVVVDGALRLGPDAPVKVTDYTPKPDEMAAPAAAAGAKGAAQPAASASSASQSRAAGGSSSPMPPAPGTAAVAKSLAPGGSSTAGAPASEATPRDASAAIPAAESNAVVVLFTTGTATLDPNAGLILKGFAQSVKAGTSPIEVSGYTDRTGNHAANVDLARRRATTVRDALVAQGISADRVRMKPPRDITGTGSDTEARRVEIAVAK